MIRRFSMNVGLIVLDEGHMIGLGEREVRYEVQIQRLLKRADAAERRIVCLSAILPDGQQLNDFVNWIRRDRRGDAIRSEWRPTRLRYGEVLWRNRQARLEIRVGNERPFVPIFFKEKPPLSGRRTELFPRDKRELVIATAWRLLDEGQSVLIYCPERRSVSPYANAIIDLASKGFIEPVLDADNGVLADALTIGREWLGDEHPILRCLKLGVAVHHGALPTPFRKEMERLLRIGTLKVIVSSPTLAQGLNLTATSIVMHSIQHFRDGEQKTIEASDFKNIVGRAGRAFVDVEGLVLFPIFDRHTYWLQKWNELLNETSSNEMESGLLRLIDLILKRLSKSLGTFKIDEFLEYVLNNAAAWDAWDFPIVSSENKAEKERAQSQWYRDLSVLDTALLSLLGEKEIAVEELSVRLDDLLSSSFWQRRIAHHQEKYQALFRATLEGRAKFIWTQSSNAQRRGYFLAGVGLTSGQTLDTLAAEVNPLLIEANSAILEHDNDRAVSAILGLAERLFKIEPFVPAPLPEQWRYILELWLKGEPITGAGDDVPRFVENGLVYKLPWAIDAVRVRARANNDSFDLDGMKLTIDEFETGLLVPCVETGTLNTCAARLIQAGFGSRLAAIKAVSQTNADFTNVYQLREWLQSPVVQKLRGDESWPTAESHQLWLRFLDQYMPSENLVWSVQSGVFPVTWNESENPPADEIVRLWFANTGECTVLSSAFEELGRLNVNFTGRPEGVFEARCHERTSIRYSYRGPNDIVVAK